MHWFCSDKPLIVTINYRQLYAQAMNAVCYRERYWLDDADTEEGEWLTAMQIINYLQTKTKDKLAINKVAVFGRTL